MSGDQVLLDWGGRENKRQSQAVLLGGLLCVFCRVCCGPTTTPEFLAASRCQSWAQLWITGLELPPPAASRCSLAH